MPSSADLDLSAYAAFDPRPDQPDRQDQQAAFYNSRAKGIAWIVGGNGAGCLAAEQEIFDPVANRFAAVSAIGSEFHVWARTKLGEVVIAKASRPKVFGVDDLYEVTLSNGCRFVSTLGHRVHASSDSWVTVGDSSIGQLGLSEFAPRELFQSSFPKCEPRSSHTPSNCPDGCSPDHHQCGGQLRKEGDTAQESIRRQGDAPERIRSMPHAGGRACKPECSRLCRCGDRPSTNHFGCPERHDCEVSCACEAFCSQSSALDGIPIRSSESNTAATPQSKADRRFPQESFRNCTTPTFHESAKAFASETCDIPNGGNDRRELHITSIRFVRRDVYWDFSVEQYENYWLAGAWHHNTTEVAMAKVAKFVLSDQPPPRKDTPFWIIAESYEQVCKACWKEKLFGHGHIPECEIDRPRIRWYKPNQNWPFEVPLRPWPGYEGRNWSLQFKSYKQGRGQMQAESIGGFCFVEQFPWGLLEEVLRGCREYNFPGSKMCEFTPVDPRLSVELEDMIEKGSVPEGWEIYRANTECALEAGHVSAEWFREFFGMVPEEMRMTRMTGAFASFQGAIYKNFNPAVHLVGDETITFPPNIYHRRAIDWGAGPSNAFCCLWAYKDGMGRWFVYDEYYSTDTSLTTIEHLCEVQDRWPWPEGNPHYGTTYADPSDPGNLRIAAKLSAYVDNRENIWITPASNAVHEGIEHVQYLFKPSSVRGENGEVVRREPMLFIHKEACPILSKQLRTYRWMNPTESGINPRDARKEPLKKDDHACFPESVLVATPTGSVRLGDVRSGDEIITHRGVGRVDVGATKMGTREVIRVTLQDGRSIVCTAEHPLAVGGADWVAAGDSLGKSVNVLETEAWSVLNREPATEIEFCASSMGDSLGGDIPTRNVIRSDAITADLSEEAERKACCLTSGCTNKSTKTTSGQFQGGTSSITRTKTTTTTARKTFRSKPHPSIQSITRRTSGRPSRRPRVGTAANAVGCGIDSTRRASPQNGSPSDSSVRIAARNFAPRIAAPLPGSVRRSAGHMPESRVALTTSAESAASADVDSSATASHRRKLARKNVSASVVVRIERNIGTEDVYNLSTSDGTFFANGILVSNCDALRYLVYSEDRMTGSTPEAFGRDRDDAKHGVKSPGRSGRRWGHRTGTNGKG